LLQWRLEEYSDVMLLLLFAALEGGIWLLELAAYCYSWLVQSCLLEEDLLGGDYPCVVETSTASAGKRRLLLGEQECS
jgi:hypothetical protein